MNFQQIIETYERLAGEVEEPKSSNDILKLSNRVEQELVNNNISHQDITKALENFKYEFEVVDKKMNKFDNYAIYIFIFTFAIGISFLIFLPEDNREDNIYTLILMITCLTNIIIIIIQKYIKLKYSYFYIAIKVFSLINIKE